MVDRILVWSFVVFAVGLAELFALFVLLAIVGRINLPRAFEEKNSGDVDSEAAEAEASGGKQRTPKHTISLSRLQAFMWTLIVMTVYFHRVVTNKSGELPTIPAELLMVMGISSAVYLTSKGIEAQSSKQKPAASSQVGAGATSAQVQTVGGG